ncbi:MAG: hypothetical protein WC291_05670 [Thermodesulfovibrionales bacterium]
MAKGQMGPLYCPLCEEMEALELVMKDVTATKRKLKSLSTNTEEQGAATQKKRKSTRNKGKLEDLPPLDRIYHKLSTSHPSCKGCKILVGEGHEVVPGDLVLHEGRELCPGCLGVARKKGEKLKKGVTL